MQISIEWFRLFSFMKNKLISFLLLMAGLSVYAEEAKIVIKQKSGNESVLELSAKPVITFVGEKMVVSSDIITIMIPIEDIDDYVFHGESTGIKPMTETPQFVDGNVVFSNIAKGTIIRILSLDGSLVRSQTADSSGKTVVSLDQLHKGNFIISAGKCQIKVFKK